MGNNAKLVESKRQSKCELSILYETYYDIYTCIANNIDATMFPFITSVQINYLDTPTIMIQVAYLDNDSYNYIIDMYNKHLKLIIAIVADEDNFTI